MVSFHVVVWGNEASSRTQARRVKEKAGRTLAILGTGATGADVRSESEESSDGGRGEETRDVDNESGGGVEG